MSVTFAILAVAFAVHAAAQWATGGVTPSGSSHWHRGLRWLAFYGCTVAALVLAVLGE